MIEMSERKLTLERALISLCGVVMGVECLLSSLLVFGPLRPAADITSHLTQATREFYFPERDLLIYIAGCLFVPLFALALQRVWQRKRAAAATSASLDSRLFLQSIAVLLGPSLYINLAALGYALERPVALSESRQGALIWLGVTLGIVSCQAALLFAGARASSEPFLKRQCPRPFAAACRLLNGCLAAVPGIALSALSAPSGAQPPETADRGKLSGWLLDSAIAILFFAAVFIPDAARTIGTAYTADQLHHWNFFVFAPLNAYLHGRALGTEVYAQYGVGWPVVLSALRPVLELNYSGVLRLFMTLAGLYFVGLYFLLRSLGSPRSIAFAGTGVALLLQQFATVSPGMTIWTHPSSTVIRYLMDVTLFTLLWRCLKTGRRRCWVGAAATTAVALWLETDTGVYLIGAVLVFVAAWLLQTEMPRKALCFRLLGTGIPVFAAVFLAGIFLSSRGTCFQKEFWNGWLEGILFYKSGMGALPFDLTPALVVPTILTFTLYFFGVCGPLERLLRRDGTTGAIRATSAARPTERDVFTVSLTAYGLCSLLLFIGRTHPLNLLHCIVPLVLLVTLQATPLLVRLWGVYRSVRQARLLACLAGACAGLYFFSNPCITTYPSLLRAALPSRLPTAFDLSGYTKTGSDPVLGCGITGAPDSIVAPGEAKKAREFQEAVQALRKYRDPNQRILILSNEDTCLYQAADLPIWGRYSPLLPLLLTWEATQKLQNTLSGSSGSGAPDVVFLETEAASLEDWPYSADILARLQPTVERRYSLVGGAGHYRIFQRRSR